MQTYVTVKTDEVDGNTVVLSITWPDGREDIAGATLEVERVQFAGQDVTRYAVVFDHRRRFVYQQDDGQWFVVIL